MNGCERTDSAAPDTFIDSIACTTYYYVKRGTLINIHPKVKVDQLYGIVSSLTGTPLDQKVK